MGHGCHESLQRLSGECAGAFFGDGHGEHDPEIGSKLRADVFGGVEGGFGIESVEYGLYQDYVGPVGDKCGDLLAIGSAQHVVGYIAPCGVADIGAHRSGLVCGTHRAGDIYLPVGVELHEAVGRLAGYCRRG